MGRKERLVFLFFSLLVLLVVGRVCLGSFSFVTSDFWFTAGLLLLILLSAVDQPHFSSDANIFMNGVAGMLSLLTVPLAHRGFLWVVFLIWAVYLVMSTFVIMLLKTRDFHAPRRLEAVLTALNRQIGRPEAIFSAFFLWGVATQFESSADAYRALFIFWVVFIVILRVPEISRAIARILEPSPPDRSGVAGKITGFCSPRPSPPTVTTI